MRMLANAIHETIAVVRATGRRIVPASAAILYVLPRLVVAKIFRALLSSRVGEIGAGWHCSQAPDEMLQLARELKELVGRSDVSAPALSQLLAEV